MRVFITGASGWIGSGVVSELLEAGHQVVGLARSDASAAALAAAGAEVHRGSLDDLAGLEGAAAASDGVIHLAFKHDIAFSGGFQAAADADRRAVETFGEALAGSDRPLLIASGTLGLALGSVATERDGHELSPALAALGGGPQTRHATAELALSLASRGVRSSILRLPPTNHGEGDHGFMATLVRVARDKGVSGYVGEGATAGLPSTGWIQRTSSAWRSRGLRRARRCTRSRTEGVPLRDIAGVIGHQLDLPVVSIAPDDAIEHFTPLGGFVGLDSPASSALTRELLGWEPTHPGLIDDLDQGHYFR